MCSTQRPTRPQRLPPSGRRSTSSRYLRDAPGYFHPGRSGALKLGPKNTLAVFGEFHPRILRSSTWKARLSRFEVFLDAICRRPNPRRGRSKGALNASDLMPVRRDFAFVVGKDVAAETLLRAARGADKALIAGVSLFDVYEGKGIGEDEKSLAIVVELQPVKKTLTDEEIEAVGKKIVAAVEKATGGTLRG
jgi:phenylalanyl-tRNA synthetase beta chain